MVERWKDFDWREVEARINAHPNFLTEIDGQTIHFVHVRSAVPGARPLLLAHTYPGSFLEFLPMVDALTDPESHGGRAEDAFDVVIPSMPGFGFSTPLVEGGWTMARVARTCDTLMRRLGYPSYGVHGSDAGAMVGRELAVLDPEGFRGAHVLQLFSFPSGDPAEFEGFGPKEYAALEHMQWFQSVGGYNAMNASRPQTIAAGLSDSPVGQLAYSELFESFGNGTSRVTARAGAGAGQPLLADQHGGRLGPLLLRGGPRRARAGGEHRAPRRRRLRARLPDDQVARRARQRQRPALDGARRAPGTSPPWRTRTRSWPTCAPSSATPTDAPRAAAGQRLLPTAAHRHVENPARAPSPGYGPDETTGG